MAEARDTANAPWWQQFQDPVLDSLIAEALARNLNVKIAAANVEQAAAVLTQTRARSTRRRATAATHVEASAETERAGPGSTSRTRDAYQVLAGASWEIDLWGRIRRLSEAARAQLLATEEARRGVILSLVASVANGYLQLRALDEQLVIATAHARRPTPSR